VIILLQPRNDDGSIEPARIGEGHFFGLQHRF
jgi:hypothetical protein